VFQFRDVFPDERGVFVPFSRKGDRGVAAVELGVEGCAGEPLPVSGVAGCFVVDEPFLRGCNQYDFVDDSDNDAVG